MKHRKTLSMILLSALLLSGCAKNAPGDIPDQSTGTAEEPALSIVVNSETKEEDDGGIDAFMAEMTLEQKVSQMIMPSIRYWGQGDAAEPVTELNPELKEAIQKDQFGGIILFAQNTQETEQTVRLVQEVQEANASGEAKSALFIAIDQEGGKVSRLEDGTQMPGNMALGATGDPAMAKEAATVIGEELASLGINVNFAPVVDVNNNPANPVIGVRSFSDDAQVVAAFGKEYMAGLCEQKVIPALKHFPGHGDTDTDSHTGLPSIDKSVEELKSKEWIPYQECLQDADMVMTAHIEYPQIEKEVYVSKETGQEITLPATLSKTMITDILRGQLGYDGVVVTDSLEMGAIAKHFDRTDVARYVILSGANLLLMPFDMVDEAGIDDAKAYVESIVKMVEDGEIPKERIDDSVKRLLTVKQKYGLLDVSSFAADPESRVENAKQTVGSKAHHDKEWEIALRAVTEIKNSDKTLPFNKSAQTVVFLPQEDQLNAVAFAKEKLVREGVLSEDAKITAVCYDKKAASEAAGMVRSAESVIIVSALSKESELNPGEKDGEKSAWIDAALRSAKEAQIPVLLISALLPYDVARYPDADAILVCYNAKGMEALPSEDGAVRQYGANLPAAICAAFYDEKPSGILPVTVPVIDESYHYTDLIAYASGYADKQEKPQTEEIVLGDEQFDAYLPLLENKRVALFSNHTGIVGDACSWDGAGIGDQDVSLIPFGLDPNGNEVTYGPHILDALIDRGIQVVTVFSPEHGFDANADAGASVDDSVDERTNINIVSLYGNKTKPSESDMDGFDVLLVDMQDVGVRYYTYSITLSELMDACAKYDREVVILDRPNPNGFYVDGPILKEGFHSGVGKLPLPVVYGMTWGELAQMINGEGWLDAGKDACKLKVIPCRNYTHEMAPRLIKNPSPNLKDMRSVFLYASTCYFENTALSVGRGTNHPFEIYGSPYLKDDPSYPFTFTPKSMSGATNPPFQGQTCYGKDLRKKPADQIKAEGIRLDYLLDAYHDLQKKDPSVSFFGKPDQKGRYWIDLLMGTDEVRKMIEAGKSAQEIKDSWKDETEAFLKQREPYLLYP